MPSEKCTFQGPSGTLKGPSTHLSNFSELKSAKTEVKVSVLGEIKGNLSKNFLSESKKCSSEIST